MIANALGRSFEARKRRMIAASLERLAEMRLPGPVKVTVAFAMFEEQARLRERSPANPNGEDALRRKIAELVEVSRVNGMIHWELVAVDDGEPTVAGVESSGAVTERIFREFPDLHRAGRLRVEGIDGETKARLKSKKGGAIVRAARRARRRGADYFVYTDADLSVDLKQLGLLLEPAIREGKDVVIGSRRLGGSVVARRDPLERIMGATFNRVVRTLLPPIGALRIRDTQCGFKLFSRRALQAILVPDRFDHHWSFDPEWLLLAHLDGLEIAEVPIAWIGSRKEAKKALSDIWIMTNRVRGQRRHLRRSRRGG